MKAKNFLENYESINENEFKDILEWCCPSCSTNEIPDEDRKCPNCGFEIKKDLNDHMREVYSKIYDKIFSSIRNKLMEDDLVGTNTLKMINTLSRLGVIQRLRSGRYTEAYKIPKEFVVSAFVEGKNGFPRLRKMVLRRQRKA